MATPGWWPCQRQRRTGNGQRGGPIARGDDFLEGRGDTVGGYGGCCFLGGRWWVRHHRSAFLRVGVVQLRWQMLILDIRLTATEHCEHTSVMQTTVSTYASSKFVIESLMPSAPFARVSLGKSFMPPTLLSSETRSDSSLYIRC